MMMPTAGAAQSVWRPQAEAARSARPLKAEET